MLPPQALLRSVVRGGKIEDPHTTPEYHKVLKAFVSSGDLTCALCGWSLDRKTLNAYIDAMCTFEAEVVDGESVKKSESEIPAGGLFAVDHIDHDHTNKDPSNLRLVCEVCHHSEHIAFPAMTIGGTIGLIATMTQEEINTFWRLSIKLTRENHPHAKRMAAQWSAIVSQGDTAMAQAVRAVPGREQSLVTPMDLGYWLAYIDEELYSRATVAIPDLRFFPSENSLFATVNFYNWLGRLNQPAPAVQKAPSLVPDPFSDPLLDPSARPY